MNIVEQMKDVLKQEIKEAVIKAGLAEAADIPEVVLEVPKDKAHGDYSTNMAMQLARIAKKRRAALRRTLSLPLIKEKRQLISLILRGRDSSTFTWIINI